MNESGHVLPTGSSTLATHNQVVNLVSGEDRQQIFEVRVEWHVP
jgi:hypothetical protein